jgi:hypothetical protein
MYCRYGGTVHIVERVSLEDLTLHDIASRQQGVLLIGSGL